MPDDEITVTTIRVPTVLYELLKEEADYEERSINGQLVFILTRRYSDS